MYAAIGSALTSWVYVERSLVLLLSLIINIKENQAGIILYTNVNVGIWISLLTELMTAAPEFQKPMKRWGTLSNELRGLKKMRDRLAHHTTVFKNEENQSSAVAVLTPTFFDQRIESLKYSPLTFSDITKFEEQVLSFSKTLDLFKQDCEKAARGSS